MIDLNNHFAGSLDKKHDISIIGDGSSSGGVYGKVKVVGDSSFNDNLFCDQFKCTGTSVIYGSLESTDIKITGTLTLKERSAVGSDEQEDNHASNLYAKAEHMKVVGELHVSGDCQVENMKLNGRFTITGMLSAESMTLKIMGPSEVKEMGGSIISVKNSRGKLLEGLFTGNKSILKADLIEGDEIELENTEAEVVRGDKIKIGPGCRIGTVEYRSSLQIHPQSEVLVQSNRSLD
ncbi:hypothetical protein HP548_02245 [Paenibacillus taichungensis]|uniref:Cytoskeletal protein CcmA (Bactofilin family) n=1 Tax=Paenibacillus taichungensis TaxID=484184 RepID=A0ABX2MIM6_9BACL|nr:hypothetical protein [Paenibacillus taichungensis]NUU52917.1 hypothetical protein [Paenibacillus taichungensis]